MKIKSLLSGAVAALTLTTALGTSVSAVVQETQLGDVNGDGVLNVRDCAFIARKLAERRAEDLPLGIADFNGDGIVNIRDAAALSRFLATIRTVPTEIKGDTTPFAFDWSKSISSYFGYSDSPTGEVEFHTGVNFAVPHGTEELAVSDGKVAKVYTECTHDYEKTVGCGCGGNFGNYVSIITEDGYYITYSHMAAVNVKVGDKVKNGQVIGTAGATGWSTETNLHLEIRVGDQYGNPIDPLTYIKPYKTVKTVG